MDSVSKQATKVTSYLSRKYAETCPQDQESSDQRARAKCGEIDCSHSRRGRRKVTRPYLGADDWVRLRSFRLMSFGHRSPLPRRRSEGLGVPAREEHCWVDTRIASSSYEHVFGASFCVRVATSRAYFECSCFSNLPALSLVQNNFILNIIYPLDLVCIKAYVQRICDFFFFFCTQVLSIQKTS